MRGLAVLALLASGCEAQVGEARQAIVGGSNAPDDVAVVGIVRRSVACQPEVNPVSCTGTLVAPRVVVTAAHCLEGAPANAFEVFFGAAYPDGIRIPVVGGRAHPEFDPATHANDIAALILATVPPGDITPVPYEMGALPDVTGAPVRLVGYGISAGSASDVGTRRAGTARVSEVGSDDLRVVPDPAMSCRGDSGGPVFAMLGAETLIGVTAYGDPACTQFGVAMRVDRQLAFLQPVLDEAAGSPERRPFEPGEKLCATSCGSDADCPAETVCFASQCSYRGLPAGEFGSSCTSDGACACVALPDGTCREFVPCFTEGDDACTMRAAEDGCGCASGRGGGAGAAMLAAAVTAMVGRRRRSARTARP